MALMFQRIAYNYAKNGYYPTDSVTMERLLQAIDSDGTAVSIFDPCCGEGSALAEVKHHLQTLGTNPTAYGVEFDLERAQQAKKMLDYCIKSDINDCYFKDAGVGLLFLNPPYGQTVRDMSASGYKMERLELLFLKKTMPSLQLGGMMVLIVPNTILDEQYATILARNFDRIEAYLAPERQFKQVVIFAQRTKLKAKPDAAALLHLKQAAENAIPELPEIWTKLKYSIPQQPATLFKPITIQLDSMQLKESIQANLKQTLWNDFATIFTTCKIASRRPLKPLSQWHLALALASGQIGGMIESSTGRRLLIKGSTHKVKQRTKRLEETENGDFIEVIHDLDRFVPIIKAIDFTAGPQFGTLVEIK